MTNSYKNFFFKTIFNLCKIRELRILNANFIKKKYLLIYNTRFEQQKNAFKKSCKFIKF